MSLRVGIVVAVLVSALAASPAAAADLWSGTGADTYDPPSSAYESGSDTSSAYDSGDDGYTDNRRAKYRGYERQSYKDDYRPRVRRVSAFDQVRYELGKFGYTRIVYRTRRTDRYGEPIYYLTACHNGVRYRLHVTADCEIVFKRRAGFCRSRYSY